MSDNELKELQRANPVSVDAVAGLVAAHRSALVEAIGGAPAPAVGAPRGAAESEQSTTWESAADRPARLGIFGAAAAALLVFALPVLLLTRASGNDVVEQEFPSLDELPTPSEVDSPDGNPASDPENDLFEPNPSNQQSAPSTTSPTPTTAPSVTTVNTSPTSTVDTETDTALPPVVPTASTSPATVPTTAAATQTEPAIPPTSAPTTDPTATTPSGTSPTSTAPPATAPSTAPATTIAPTTTSPAVSGTSGPTTGNDTSQPFDPTTDLLVVHLDFANRDDGHATVAAREIATSREIDLFVVAGTQAPESTGFVQPYDTVMSAAWGSDWLDAGTNRAAAVAAAANRWLETIDTGGVVRIAEGGVSDFTADVVRELQVQRPALDLTTVVQLVHHNGRNEEETRSGDLDLVQAHTAYVRIDDGNSANGTANLNGASSAFESAALAGTHSDAWLVAFDYLPATSLDFSDTVTALHILGVGTNLVADADGFAAEFIS